MMKKKVLVVIPDLGPGGGQSTAIEIVNHIDNKDLEFKIVSLYSSKNTLLEKRCKEYGINIIFLNKKKGFDLKTIRDLNKVIKEYKPDVIHAHLRVMLHLLLPMIKNKTRKRLYTVHNIASKDGQGFNKYLLNFAFKRCKVTPVAISHYCRDSITEYYGIKKENIPIVYIGTNTNAYKRTSPYNCLNDEIISFVACGRLTVQKNYYLMIDAFNDALKINNNLYLKIIGEGEELVDLREYVIKNNLIGKVEITGRVDDVKIHLDNAHIYLMTSDYEGLPQTILESMSMGLPVITTKAGGIVDVVKENRNGILVDIGDKDALTKAILDLADSKDKRIEYSKNNEIDAENYSFEKCAKAYERLYLED